jgi:imidazolonepropionase
MSSPLPSLEIRNASCLATPLGRAAKRGREQGEIHRITGAAVRVENGLIAFAGPEAEYRRRYSGSPAAVSVDATGHTLLPGLVDSHTHPVWAGDRGPEIGRRLAGESYATIAAEGGGINATVRATREATTEELARLLRGRLERMRAHGTTTVEAKSGYGLTSGDEIRALEILAEAARDAELPRIVPTLLAAHEIPPEYRDRRAEWVECIEREIVPAAARRGLARFCDVLLRRRGLHRGRVAHDPRGGPARRARAPDPCRRTRALGRRVSGRRARGGFRGSLAANRRRGGRGALPVREPSRRSCREPPGGCDRAPRRRGS